MLSAVRDSTLQCYQQSVIAHCNVNSSPILKVNFLRLDFSVCERSGTFSSGILRRIAELLVADVPRFRSGLIFNGGSFETSGIIRPTTHRHIF